MDGVVQPKSHCHIGYTVLWELAHTHDDQILLSKAK